VVPLDQLDLLVQQVIQDQLDKAGLQVQLEPLDIQVLLAQLV